MVVIDLVTVAVSQKSGAWNYMSVVEQLFNIQLEPSTPVRTGSNWAATAKVAQMMRLASFGH